MLTNQPTNQNSTSLAMAKKKKKFHFSVASKDKPHAGTTNNYARPHGVGLITCFFLCFSAPPPVAPSGVDVSGGRSASHSAMSAAISDHRHQRGAAPRPNVSSCPENLGAKERRWEEKSATEHNKFDLMATAGNTALRYVPLWIQ